VRIRALESGAKDYLTKPFDPLEVVTRIRNIVEVRLLNEDLRHQNAILEQKVRERTEELRQTRLEIIHRLSRAAEFHDAGTGVHIMRMSQYCALVARAAGLSETRAELVLSASPMHDVGKIGIPDSLLLKPGPLNAEERAAMERHTSIGAELLSGHESPLMRMAAQIALTHHERWDGQGYPQGLAGEDIPLVGRIVSVCDVFDALVSRRPYKPPWPWEQSVREVDDLSGSAFDPDVVHAFHVALPAIQEIMTRVASREHHDSEGRGPPVQ
jgi:putative two-component system response regulator